MSPGCKGSHTFNPCLYALTASDSSYVEVLWPQRELIFSVGPAVFQGRFSDGSATGTIAL